MNLAENDSYKEKERSTVDTGSNLGEEVRDILTALKAVRRLAILKKNRFPFLKKWQRC